MKFSALLSWILIEISLLKLVDSHVWWSGKCRRPRPVWDYTEYRLLGVRQAWQLTRPRWARCVYIDVSKGRYKNHFNVEMTYRIFNTTQAEWKFKQKGTLKVSNDSRYFNGRLEFPYNYMSFYLISESWNCLCTYSCQQLLLLHRWDVHTFHSNNRWCGFWFFGRCQYRLEMAGIYVEHYWSETPYHSCPRITEDNDHAPKEPDDCKMGKKIGNFFINSSTKIATKINKFYSKIMKKFFNETVEKVTTRPIHVHSSTPRVPGTTTVPPFYKPGEPYEYDEW